MSRRSVVRFDPDELPEAAPGDSLEQRLAERLMIDALSRQLGLQLGKVRQVTPEGQRVEIDGLSTDPAVLVEAWAHQGKPKAAQKNKVLSDVVKMLWVDKTLFGGAARKILAVSDTLAVEHFMGKSWMAAAVRDFGIEIRVVDLPADVRMKIAAAQKKQFR